MLATQRLESRAEAGLHPAARPTRPAQSTLPRARVPGAGSLVIAALVLAPAVAGAQAEPPTAATVPGAAASAPAVDPAPGNKTADAARSSVRAFTHWLVSGLDSWFGDRPFEEGGKITDGLLSVDMFKRQREGIDFNLRFNANVHLPNLEDQAYLFLGRDDPRVVVSDQPRQLSRQDRLLAQANAERRFFAGIGRSLTDTLDFRLGFRAGLRLYAQGRYKTQWTIGAKGLAEFRQTVFWSPADRVGSTTAFLYEHLLSPGLATRWLTSATITQASKRYEWSSQLGLHRSFGDQRLLSLEALINGQQDSGVAATDYGVQARWEQPVYRDWLIGGVVVGHFWPRPDAQTERSGAWAAGASLLMRF